MVLLDIGSVATQKIPVYILTFESLKHFTNGPKHFFII